MYRFGYLLNCPLALLSSENEKETVKISSEFCSFSCTDREWGTPFTDLRQVIQFEKAKARELLCITHVSGTTSLDRMPVKKKHEKREKSCGTETVPRHGEALEYALSVAPSLFMTPDITKHWTYH